MIIFSEILLKILRDLFGNITNVTYICNVIKSNNTTNIGKITYRSDNISNENERINRKKTILLLRKCIRICPKEVVSKLLKLNL